MALKEISKYREYLEGCRFCPMCKPVAEVANVTQYESHTTRARAMMLWRYLEGMMELTERDIELLYQSTLDTISEAWCVHHYKVSSYLLAARNEIVRMKRAPERVKEVLKVVEGEKADSSKTPGDTIFLAGEFAELTVFEGLVQKEPGLSSGLSLSVIRQKRDNYLEVTNKLLGSLGFDTPIVMMQNGVLPHVMGDFALAKIKAENIARLLFSSKIKRVIADSPQTLWALKVLLPSYTKQILKTIEIVSLSEAVGLVIARGKAVKNSSKKENVYVHDTRYPFFLGETPADDRALPPDFSGPEEALGQGAVYEVPRKVVDDLGFQRVFSVWSRSLCRSCGTDDGLYITYPKYAQSLAMQCFEHADMLGAQIITTESPLSALWLQAHNVSGKTEVRWFPELVL